MTWTTSRQADEAIERLYEDGLDRFGLDQADRYQDGLYDTFELLVRHPKIARIREEFSPPVRVHPYGRHLVIYREIADGIRILMIRHSREDWQGRLRRP